MKKWIRHRNLAKKKSNRLQLATGTTWLYPLVTPNVLCTSLLHRFKMEQYSLGMKEELAQDYHSCVVGDRNRHLDEIKKCFAVDFCFPGLSEHTESNNFYEVFGSSQASMDLAVKEIQDRVLQFETTVEEKKREARALAEGGGDDDDDLFRSKLLVPPFFHRMKSYLIEDACLSHGLQWINKPQYVETTPCPVDVQEVMVEGHVKDCIAFRQAMERIVPDYRRLDYDVELQPGHLKQLECDHKVKVHTGGQFTVIEEVGTPQFPLQVAHDPLPYPPAAGHMTWSVPQAPLCQLYPAGFGYMESSLWMATSADGLLPYPQYQPLMVADAGQVDAAAAAAAADEELFSEFQPSATQQQVHSYSAEDTSWMAAAAADPTVIFTPLGVNPVVYDWPPAFVEPYPMQGNHRPRLVGTGTLAAKVNLQTLVDSHPYYSEGHRLAMSLAVPKRNVGYIIGYKGVNIQSIQKRHGVSICIEQDDGESADTTATIRGNVVDRMRTAKAEVMVLARGKTGTKERPAQPVEKEEVQQHPPPPDVRMRVHPRYFGKIVGIRGQTVSRLREEYGAERIVIPFRNPADHHDGLIDIYAAEDCDVGGLVDAMIEMTLDQRGSSPQSFQASAAVLANSEDCKNVIGRNGIVRDTLKAMFKVQIDVPRCKDLMDKGQLGVIAIRGSTDTKVRKARDAVENIIHNPLTVTLPYRQLAPLLNRHAKDIKQLENKHNVEIRHTPLAAKGQEEPATAVITIRGALVSEVKKAMSGVKLLLPSA